MRGFNADEDSKLSDLFMQHGPRWKQIAQDLSEQMGSERTAAMVRNRWLRVEKGKKEASEGKARNKCGLCGQVKKGHVCTARALVTTQQVAQICSAGNVAAPAAAAASSENLPPIAQSYLGVLELGSPTALTFEPGQENSTLQLFAQPIAVASCDSANAAIARQPPIATSCIWSPQTSPGIDGVAPSPDITAASLAASLLAPTPEGGMFSFPPVPTSVQPVAPAVGLTASD